jgi:hypothetical protein
MLLRLRLVLLSHLGRVHRLRLLLVLQLLVLMVVLLLLLWLVLVMNRLLPDLRGRNVVSCRRL